MRIILYSQEELIHYRLDQSDLEHPGGFDIPAFGSEIVKNKKSRKDSNEETGNL